MTDGVVKDSGGRELLTGDAVRTTDKKHGGVLARITAEGECTVLYAGTGFYCTANELEIVGRTTSI